MSNIEKVLYLLVLIHVRPLIVTQIDYMSENVSVTL